MSTIYPKSKHEHRKAVLYAKKRRLQELELLAALRGFNTSPETIIEIERLQSELRTDTAGTKAKKKRET